MRSSMQFQILCVLVCFLSISYCSKDSAQLTTSNTSVQSKDSVLQGCDEEWDSRISRLTSVERDQFAKDGILVGGSETEAYFLISTKIVPDCKSRIEIGGLLWRIYEDKTLPEDLEYANRHSVEITSAIRGIWDSANLKDEKYLWLTFSGLDDEDVGPIIADDLKNNEYNSSRVWVTIERPLASPIQELKLVLQRSERSGDVVRSICALIALELATNDKRYLQKLNRTADSGKLSAQTKRRLRSLISRLDRQERITFADVEAALGVTIPD